jgi:hypothetical protein
VPKFTDDLYLGGAKIPFPADPANPSPMTEGVGPLGRIYVIDAVPAAATANNIVVNATPAGAGDLALNPAPTGGATVRVGSDNKPQIVLDYPRAVSCGATTGGAPFVVYGTDAYGQPMAENFAAAGTGKKAFKTITRITAGAAGTAVNVGTADIFGLPFRLVDKGYIVSSNYGGAALPLANYNVADSNTATGTTGDVRGTIGGQALDGIKRLVVVLAMPAIQVGPNATRLGVIGVPQYAG